MKQLLIPPFVYKYINDNNLDKSYTYITETNNEYWIKSYYVNWILVTNEFNWTINDIEVSDTVKTEEEIDEYYKKFIS